ncbi:hypothetical protein Dimus_004425 [Dionaea muscipula]
MGSKKRGSASVVEEVAVEDSKLNDYSQKRASKKKKKEVEHDAIVENTLNVPSKPTDESLKPMERRKKRKAMDKERHRISIENKVTKAEQEASQGKGLDKIPLITSSMPTNGSGTPEFHISVFNNLASADASTREAAVEVLVKELLEVQKAYEKGGNEEVSEGGFKLEAEKDDGLDNCAPSVRYAVRRLIRGVSSSRECARQGFALGLTVLVSVIPSIRVGSLLKLILQLLEVTSSMKGQEAKDCLLGRLFAYGALARSRRLKDEWLSDKSTSSIKEFTSHLISLASKKRYLQEPAVSVLQNLIEMLPTEVVLNHVLEAPGLKEWFDGADDAGNPDALLLALEVRNRISVDSTIFGKLLPYPFSPSKVFTFAHLSSLTNCLKESGFCQPRVHGVWPVLVNILLPCNNLQDDTNVTSTIKKHKKSRKSGSSDEDLMRNLKCFCETVLEGSLLSSSHDRKHLAFDVILLMLPRLSASYLPIVLSYKFVRCLVDVLSTKDSWLFKVAEHFLKTLSDWVENDSTSESDTRRVYVIVALQKHSNGRFDFDTRTRTVRDLMTGFKTESGCKLLIQELTDMFLDDAVGSDEPSDQSQTTDDNSEMGSVDEKEDSAAMSSMSSDQLKSWVIESIPSITKNLKLDPEAIFRVQKEVMKFLAVQGLFYPSLGREVTSFELQEKFKWPKESIPGALSRMCVEQLQLLFSSSYKSNGLENDLGCYFTRFFSALCGIPTVSLIRRLSVEDEKVFKDLQAMESRLYMVERNCQPSSEEEKKLHALRYLLLQLVLQLLLQPAGDLSEAASELIICCQKAFAVHDLLDSAGEEETEHGESPHLMDVLVDTLLSILPQASAPMRSSVEQVFRFFCKDVTEDGLIRMLRVIKKDLKPSRRKVTDSGDYDDDDNDDDLLSIEEADEAEMASTGDESGDEKTDDTEAAVVSTKVVVGGEEVLEAASYDSESDEGMDDDAMFRMDSVVARIFQERKNQAGSGTAHSQLVLFKLRVLSLLEIYVHKNPGKPQVVSVYSNLLQAFLNPHTMEGSEQLGQRIKVILRKIFEAAEYPKLGEEGVQLSTLESLLEKSLMLASRPFKKKKSAAANNISKQQSSSWSRYRSIKSLAQDSTYWILKIIDGGGKKSTSEEPEEVSRVVVVEEVFKSSLAAYFESNKSELKPEFLKEIFKRRPWIGRLLFGFLVGKCIDTKSSSEFRRVEALELLLEILKQKKPEGIIILERHLPRVCRLIKELVTHMPEKQSRRAQVRKFCSKLFQIVMKQQSMTESFLNTLDPDAHPACQSQLGETFLALKKKLVVEN